MRTTLVLFLSSFVTFAATSAIGIRQDSTDSLDSSVQAVCNAGCAALVKVFPTKVFDSTTAVYKYENAQFWSNTQLLAPLCVFRPTSAADVAKGIKTLRSVSGSFALRGGGHMGIKGATNIDDGVLMVTSNLSTITLSPQKDILTLGPAFRWGDVYKWLAKYDLTVAGGRLSPVGVPGLLLGGGINFYGNQVGWSCDTIEKYELVTAAGNILYVTKSSYSDLFWALKGGSSNFGIVTNFWIRTIPSRKVLAGIYSVGDSDIPAFLAAIANYSSNIKDPLSHIVPATIPVSSSPPVAIGAAILFYDSETNSNPDCFKPFFDIPSIASTVTFKTIAEFADETGTAVVDHINDIFAAGTAVGTTYAELLKSIQLTNSVFYSRLPLLYEKVPFEKISIMEVVWQPIGKLWIDATARAGGNALGLNPAKIYLAWSEVLEWIGSEYDDAANAWIKGTTDAINDANKKAGLYDPFMYMGDATGFQRQNFFSGYGSANKAKLLSISRKYDPERLFQKLMPGGFKIGI